VQQVLLRFVRGAVEGQAVQESNKATPAETRISLTNFAEHVDGMAAFIDAFAASRSSSAGRN
jgi:hypothetical protein